MSDPSEYFDRIRGQINVSLLATKHVVVIGVGTVGSPVAMHLATDGVGSFLFIDGDIYEEANRPRHVLPSDYLGENKAIAMCNYLQSAQIPTLRKLEALPYDVDESMSDDEFDAYLDPADLIVAGTGEREIQRRIGRRALALDIPAIFPALYPEGGGEVFIQTSPQSPCFFCWDGWRTGATPVRGAEALGVETMPVIQTAIELGLGVLDGDSRYDELRRPGNDDLDRGQRQLFVTLREAPRLAQAIPRREECPACRVGPAPLREQESVLRPSTPQPIWPASPTEQELPPAHAPIRSYPSWLPRAVLSTTVAALIAIAVLASGGSRTRTTSSKPLVYAPPKTSEEVAAEVTAREQKAIKARIGRLSFRCLDRYVCESDPKNHPVPVFINGMDENLRTYLEKRGYTDSWTDNGNFHAQTIGPHSAVNTQTSTVEYVSNAQEEGVPEDEESEETEVGSGLIFGGNMGGGSRPDDVSQGEWIIIWTLKNPSGKVVKQLRFTVNVIECEGENVGYCRKVQEYELDAPEGTTFASSGVYSRNVYTPPLAFPRK